MGMYGVRLGSTTDYYIMEAEAMDTGCCLLCEEASEGCLCPECKCSRCLWYKWELIPQPCALAHLFKKGYTYDQATDLFLIDGQSKVTIFHLLEELRRTARDDRQPSPKLNYCYPVLKRYMDVYASEVPLEDPDRNVLLLLDPFYEGEEELMREVDMLIEERRVKGLID